MPNKKIIYTLVLVILNSVLFSQNVTDFFMELPDSAVMGLSKKDRVEIVKGKHRLYQLPILDTKNGYLRMTGAFEGHWEMCYWNKSKETKLISVYEQACGPGCEVVTFSFYERTGNKLTALQRNSIIPVKEEDFLTGDKNKSKDFLKKADFDSNILFVLPQKGLNIIATYGGDATSAEFGKYVLGNRMELHWKNGVFSKGKVYWQE